MERSNKHGPRMDDAMSAETEPLERSGHESRTEEWREKEPAGEGQPTPDALVSGDVRGAPESAGAIPHDQLEARSELAQRLRKSVWPASRQTLENVAIDEKAPDWVLAMLRRLPDRREYVNVQDVWSTLGGDTEDVRA